MKPLWILLLTALVPLSSLHAQEEPVGIFENQALVGEPENDGIASFIEGDELYLVDAVGDSIGDDTLVDQFLFAFNEMEGSFAIEAEPFPAGNTGRGGVMIRQSLDNDAAHASLLMLTDFRVVPHVRFNDGGAPMAPGRGGFDSEEIQAQSQAVRLERMGGSVHIYRVNSDGELEFMQSEVIQFREDPLLVGLAATGDGPTAGLFEFSNVSIEELPFNAMRSLSMPLEAFEPGGVFSVTIRATVRDGETVDAVVNEVPPRGSQVTNVQASSGAVTTHDDGTIDWVLNGASGEATLTYDITLPDRPSVSFQGTFNDGINRESYIGGPSVLPVDPQFTPPDTPTEYIEVDPIFPTQIHVMNGVLDAAEDAFGFALDPRTESGVTVITVDGARGQDQILLPINIPEDGSYHFLGNVRGNDGVSDSFTFDVDFTPGDTDETTWGIPNDKQFERDWIDVARSPFQLAAGEHYVQLAAREDDSHIEWIGITTSRPDDPNAVNFEARAVANRSIPERMVDNSQSQTVELSAQVRTGISDEVILTETVPSTLAVSNINASAGDAELGDNNQIQWNLTGVTGEPATLQYDITAPEDGFGVFEISGSLQVGGDEPVAVGGDFVVALPREPIGKTAFYFRRIASNNLSDDLLMTHLQANFGVEVVQFDDSNAQGFEMPPDLSGADMAFFSETVSSGNIADMGYQTFSPVPMIHTEAFLNDDFVFQPGNDALNGTQADTTLNIVDNEHPITQNFDLGELQVWDEPMTMGFLRDAPDDVRVLATAPNDPSIAYLWVLEEGQSASGTATPGLRVGTWLHTDGFAALNSQGQRLVNQILAFALEVEAPETKVQNFMLY